MRDRIASGHRQTTVIGVDEANLERVLAATCPAGADGLSRSAYQRSCSALGKTAWGRRCLRRFALVDGTDVLASAEQHDLTGRLDDRALRISGIGSIAVNPDHRGHGYADALVDSLLDRAASAGSEMALLFLRPGADAGLRDGGDADVGDGFERLPLTGLLLAVAESPRYGAPMTMVRGGEERDLPAIAAMGRVRADPIRFHLDRDVDLIQYAITRKRLLAGLGTAHARQLHFFIAEEGTTAAAYVVISVEGNAWTLEECGDRDTSGARVGALLQALIAREPVERRPAIRGWLPPHFLPPQVTQAPAIPFAETVMVRVLAPRAMALGLSGDDILYWRSDLS